MRSHAVVVLLAFLGAALAAVGVASGASRTSEPPCIAGQLSGTFSAVPGSAGAGNISYVLRLRNRSTRACFVSGLPRLRLVGKLGKLLPTNLMPANRGALTAVRVVLKPGGYSAATARFSPDVPGVGEPVAGRQCEPTAYRARVSPPPGGGTLVVPITPPTPVFEHGTMLFSVLVAGRKGPNTP
jgi:hypothetical protein